MADIVTDEVLIDELKGMFGDEQDDDKEDDSDEPDDEVVEDDDSDTQDNEGEDDDSKESEPDEDSSELDKEKKKQAQANYKFGELRNQNKQLTNTLKKLGKALGLEDNTPVETIAERVQTALIQKESKDSNIPVEMLERLNQLEIIAQDAENIKLEKEVSESLTKLAEKYSLDGEQLTSFTNELIDNGKNPFEVKGVDIETEYLKLHFEEIISAAKDKAVSDDKARRDKAKEHAGGKVPGKAEEGGGGSGDKIETVSQLSKALDSLE